MLNTLTANGQTAAIIGAWAFACCAMHHRGIKQGWLAAGILVAIGVTILVSM